jgi:hypothetical protein
MSGSKGVAEMTTKKIRSVINKVETREVKLARTADIAAARKNDSFWEGKTGEELIREQGITPIKDEKDFARISGGQEDWDDVDKFLAYFHSH